MEVLAPHRTYYIFDFHPLDYPFSPLAALDHLHIRTRVYTYMSYHVSVQPNMASTTTADPVALPIYQTKTSISKTRRHAPGACTTCKSRRTKVSGLTGRSTPPPSASHLVRQCIVPSPGMQCDYCRHKELRCVIQSDDQRKRQVVLRLPQLPPSPSSFSTYSLGFSRARPKSRSYVASLEDRIQTLTATLARRLPTPQTLPYTQNANDTADAVGTEQEPQPLNVGSSWMPVFEVSEDQDRADDGGSSAQLPNWGLGVHILEVHSMNTKSTAEENDMESPFSRSTSSISGRPDSRASGQEHRPSAETADPGDQSTAGPRCSIPGATTSLSGGTLLCATEVESAEKFMCANRVLEDLAVTTHDYLMSLYWTSFNNDAMIVNQELFYRDKATGCSQYYSCFLHMSMLAMGFRFSDRSRSDIQMISLDTRSSILQQTSRHLAEYELGEPGELPSVQALLILSDLEYGVGKTGPSWSYAGNYAPYNNDARAIP